MPAAARLYCVGQRVPVQMRSILHGPEEQSRTRDC
jgi:hypothetical protein